MQKTNQKGFRIEKVIKKKGDKLYVEWKRYNNLFHSWINKKYIVLMSEYFPKPKLLWANVKVEIGLPNYATKADLKNATGVDILDFAKKVDLATSKSDVDELHIDKYVNV